MADANVRSAWAEARGQAPRRRIRLRIDADAPELHALPWELLQDNALTLAAGSETPFSRYLPIALPWGGEITERPIRVLAVISNPDDLTAKYNLPSADVALERQALTDALGGAKDLAIDFLDAPALQAGCTYAPGVAKRLVGDLSRIRVQRHGEAEAEVAGPVVEPVQLQVVCQRLWENLPDSGDRMIEWDEISRFGNIDQALTDFYETAVKQVMASGVSERQLRRWFATQLITPLETRGLALRGTAETAGLPNAAVDVLENRHVIRADVRAGSI